jgi:EAL domain-containing protein (putative c-di-GMP-specific phosphodiesterase class I)
MPGGTGVDVLRAVRERDLDVPVVLVTGNPSVETAVQAVELGRAIRASVARTAKKTRGVVFFVNLHPDDLLDEALFDPTSPLTALAPEIVLEITERSPIDSVPDIRERRGRLRDLGFRLAVDDLGSGYAGLASFASLEPDFVKLDRGLVAGVDREPVKARLVQSIVTVSRELRIAVVAEGVETLAERQTMTDLGCDLMQGFLFRRPDELKGEAAFSLGA